MSSTEGLEMLKNWHTSSADVIITSVTLAPKIRWSEVRARVRSVNESTLVLSGIESEYSEELDIRGATFNRLTLRDHGYIGMELRLMDGTQRLVREA
jgi:hypothetical protein